MKESSRGIGSLYSIRSESGLGHVKFSVPALTLFLSIFYYSLFTIHYSPAYAESLSDIKLDKLQKPAVAKKEWGRDPFEKPSYKPDAKKLVDDTLPLSIKVDGIISDGKKFLVIINGGFYRKNDRVNDFLIKDIEKGRIVLERDGKKYYLGIDKFAVAGAQKGGKK